MGRMHVINRKLHLYASFAIAFFILMFFITGAVMIMGNIFPRKNLVNTSDYVAINSNQEEKDFIIEVSERFNIEGSESIASTGNGRKSYIYTRPGYRAEIIFSAGKDSVKVNIRKGTVWSAMNDFHRLKGYTGWSHIVWAVFYDLSCIALILFAITGVLLWWKLERKKLPGILLLAASTGFAVFTVWYLLSVC